MCVCVCVCVKEECVGDRQSVWETQIEEYREGRECMRQTVTVGDKNIGREMEQGV